MTNATVYIVFPALVYTFPVEWIGHAFTEGEELYEYILSEEDPTMMNAFMQGFPEISVLLDANPNVRTAVMLNEMAGVAEPAWTLEQAMVRAQG